MKALTITMSAIGFILSVPFHIAEAAEAPAHGTTVSGNKFEVIPDDHDEDIKVLLPDGKEIHGEEAFVTLPTVDLSIWVAGNQFMAMPDVIHAFQGQFPAGQKPTVGLVTMPPGKVVNAMLNGGWRFRGKTVEGKPDIWGQLALGAVKKLNSAGLAQNYLIYMHNQLVLMVAKGNPKHVNGMEDLGREDLRIMLPNPINEGIMKEYAKKVLERRGLWAKLSGGKECENCAGAANVWFTLVHHREIPPAIEAGKTDVGLVWATEGKKSLAEGAQVDMVSLPPEDSVVNEVNYYGGGVPGSKHERLAQEYLRFLGSESGQAAYGKHGFRGATPADLALKGL